MGTSVAEGVGVGNGDGVGNGVADATGSEESSGRPPAHPASTNAAVATMAARRERNRRHGRLGARQDMVQRRYG